MLGVKEPDKVTINNPGQSTTKGYGGVSRFKFRAETIKERACSVCGDKGGLNSRTCTQLFPALKKAKKQYLLMLKRGGLRESTRRK
ncbi:hypothetical protein Tco_1096650 [Tanacetum coccineum]